MKNLFFGLGALVLGLAPLRAQTGGEQYKEALREYVKKMAAYGNPPKAGQSYYLHMGIETEYRPAAHKPATSVEVKMQVADGKVYCESGYVSAYIDREDAFTVVHPQRTIYRSKGGNNALALQNTRAVAVLQDSLLRTSRVLGCRRTVELGKDVQEITLEPRESVRKATRISTIRFYYDPAAAQVVRVVNAYLPEHPVRQETVTYHAIDFGSKRDMSRSARARVMTGNGKLLPAYKNYTLIDNRQ